jgi:hypothetical protein
MSSTTMQMTHNITQRAQDYFKTLHTEQYNISKYLQDPELDTMFGESESFSSDAGTVTNLNSMTW